MTLSRTLLSTRRFWNPWSKPGSLSLSTSLLMPEARSKRSRGDPMFSLSSPRLRILCRSWSSTKMALRLSSWPPRRTLSILQHNLIFQTWKVLRVFQKKSSLRKLETTNKSLLTQQLTTIETAIERTLPSWSTHLTDSRCLVCTTLPTRRCLVILRSSLNSLRELCLTNNPFIGRQRRSLRLSTLRRCLEKISRSVYWTRSKTL